MIQHHTSKRLLIALLVSVSLFGQSLVGHPKIVEVENQSEYPAEVAGYKGANAIHGETKKRFRFPVFIPFVSIAKYRDAFISGEPYFPKEALVVKTTQGRYAIWRDETGIMYSLEYGPGLDRNDCVPMPLFKQGNTDVSEKIIQSLVLLLSINKQGEITLTEHNS